MSITIQERQHFEALVERCCASAQSPIALFGAGHTARALRPTFGIPQGVISCIIDDDPSKHGCVWTGLPVVSFEEAIDCGIRSVIITAEHPVGDLLWNARGRFREHGLYVLTCPARFQSKTWDDCLIDQYEHQLAMERGVRSVYVHEYPSAKPEAAEWLLKPLISAVSEGASVCEIGSGAGLWTQHIMQKAGEYHAVDYSERLLFEVMEHRFSQHLGKLHLHHDETATLAGVPDHSIDVLFSFDVFVHFKSDLVHQFLSATQRVLKPGGRALIHVATWNEAAIEAWQTYHAPRLPGQQSIIYYNHPEWLQRSAEMLGLSFEMIGEETTWGFLAGFRPA